MGNKIGQDYSNVLRVTERVMAAVNEWQQRH